VVLEAAGAVVTDGGGQIVLLVEDVVQTSEEGDEIVLGLEAIGCVFALLASIFTSRRGIVANVVIVL